MNAQPEAVLNIQDFPRLFSKYWPSIIMSAIVCTAIFIIAANYIPKKYKAHFVLTIYSKYFQSPLIGDFVPELSDAGVTQSQRESLIRQVFTPEYLDSLGNKYGIYDSHKKQPQPSSWMTTLAQSLGLSQAGDNPASDISAQRETLRTHIEIIGLNPTTFSVGFLYSDPAVTLSVAQDIYTQIIQSFLALRMHTLLNIRDAIQSRVESLSTNLPQAETTAQAAPSSVPTNVEVVENELADVRSQIRALTAQYTDEHPLVIQLRDREKILISRLANLYAASPVTRETRRERPLRNSGTGEATRDVYSDLTKKLNYLNIVIDSDRQHQDDYFATLEPPLYPSAPLWPKKGLFALWGMALGFFGALFIAAIREYFDRSALHAPALAQQVGLTFLGELPAFPSKTTTRTVAR